MCPRLHQSRVTEHRIYKGWCAGCQHWYEAPVDFHDQVVGQGRVGVRLASLIATLRTVMRLPVRQIQTHLLTLHGVRISIGEIVELLHRLTRADAAAPRCAQTGDPCQSGGAS